MYKVFKVNLSIKKKRINQALYNLLLMFDVPIEYIPLVKEALTATTLSILCLNLVFPAQILLRMLNVCPKYNLKKKIKNKNLEKKGWKARAQHVILRG